MNWDGVLKGAAVNIANKNLWRFHDQFSMDELIGEAYICYRTVQDRYQTENDKHFMGLFKRVFSNHLHDLARKVSQRGFRGTKRWNGPTPESIEGEESIENAYGDLDNDGFVRVLFSELPEELKELVIFLLTDVGVYIQKDGKRETTGARLRRLGFHQYMLDELKDSLSGGV